MPHDIIPSLEWPIDFDHLHWQWIETPEPIWRGMRARCPVAHTWRYGGVYLPLRYADTCAIANDPEHFSSQSVVIRSFAAPQYSNPPINSDPPEHTGHRRVLLPAFSPEAVRTLEPVTRTICQDVLARLGSPDHCDAAMDFARHIPARVIAALLGLPQDDGDLFIRWIHLTLDAGTTDATAGEAAFHEMNGYLANLIAERRKHPQEDLTTYLTRARIEEAPLTDEHILGTLRLLLIAGIDTTWSSISAALLYLADHPRDCAQLCADFDRIPLAVEEFLRAFSPVTMARLIVKDCEIAGTHFRAGEMVMLSFAAANRDPAQFADAESVLLDRKTNPHIAFGFGRHKCIGATLARMEIRVALEEWLKRFPVFKRDPTVNVVWSKGTVRGPRVVPLVIQREGARA